LKKATLKKKKTNKQKIHRIFGKQAKIGENATNSTKKTIINNK
jgi:hypothetical protein